MKEVQITKEQYDQLNKLVEQKEKRNAYMRDYFKKTGYKSQKKYLGNRQSLRLLNSCKMSAKKKGLEFTINIKDINIPTHCPIFGFELTNIIYEGKGRVPTNASLDRIDSSKGYIPGNVWVISDMANRMKQDATKEELITFAEGILKLYKKQQA